MLLSRNYTPNSTLCNKNNSR